MTRALRLVLTVVALLLGSALAPAPASPEEAGAGRTPTPAIPKAQGEHCVMPTDFMRRYHMTMLKHQRDDTVHKGVRDGKFSIAQCVTCHAVDGADGRPVSYADPKHFCRSCHDYAAVQVDCFECHASRPAPAAKAAALTPAKDTDDLVALDAYLKGVRP